MITKKKFKLPKPKPNIDPEFIFELLDDAVAGCVDYGYSAKNLIMPSDVSNAEKIMNSRLKKLYHTLELYFLEKDLPGENNGK